MEFDFNGVIMGIIFFGGIKAIQGATEWVKRIFPAMPKWCLALVPVIFGLLINVGGSASLGFFQKYGIVAIVGSIIMGFLSAFSAMGLYDDRETIK